MPRRIPIQPVVVKIFHAYRSVKHHPQPGWFGLVVAGPRHRYFAFSNRILGSFIWQLHPVLLYIQNGLLQCVPTPSALLFFRCLKRPKPRQHPPLCMRASPVSETKTPPNFP